MSEDTIDISGIDRAELLAALYNNAAPLGSGWLQANLMPMTREEAQALLDGNPSGSFDYVKGRPLKVDLRGDSARFRLYDRDAGQGAFARIVDALRAKVLS